MRLKEKEVEVGCLYLTTANQYRAVLAMKGEFLGSSRFRGVTTTYSVRHNPITGGLRYRARYAGITDLNHISRSNAA